MNNFYPGTGTTLCPQCGTRFRISEKQLEACHGMVRCGHCQRAFDARPCYILDQSDLRLDLPILDEPVAPEETLSANKPGAAVTAQAVEESRPAEEVVVSGEIAAVVETASAEESGLTEAIAVAETELPEIQRDDPPHFNQTAVVADVPATLTLAEQVAILQNVDQDTHSYSPKSRKWPWAVAVFLLLTVLLAQAAYFFRSDLAARLPYLKPALTGTCQLLGCSLPLPQRANLMSIESSSIEADMVHENQIILNALLRNRAPYAQAFPNLELTLNDARDDPLARRIFKPKNYLPSPESEQTGLLPDQELSVNLHLDTADLRPAGYRLVLFYPPQ